MLNYKDFCSMENLFNEWRKYRIGKKYRRDVIFFERDLEENLSVLSAVLVRGDYRHGAYNEFYVRDPKFRRVHKADIRDRVVHQALYSALSPVYEKVFFFDSYSSRLGRGTSTARARINKFIAQDSLNNRREVYVLHGDFARYFDSIDHEILIGLLSRKICDTDFLRLAEHIIRSYSAGQPAGIGLPLGNLTSQLFANVYLHELDFFVKQILRLRYYVRYNDDFFLISPDADYLRNCAREIKIFSDSHLRLLLPDNKISLKKMSQGVDILGQIVYPWGIVPRVRLKKRADKTATIMASNYNLSSWRRTVSYLGLMKHMRSFGLSEKMRLADMTRPFEIASHR